MKHKWLLTWINGDWKPTKLSDFLQDQSYTNEAVRYDWKKVSDSTSTNYVCFHGDKQIDSIPIDWPDELDTEMNKVWGTDETLYSLMKKIMDKQVS